MEPGTPALDPDNVTVGDPLVVDEGKPNADGGVAACRAYYDQIEWGEAYCC
jgi:hypothetical protein